MTEFERYGVKTSEEANMHNEHWLTLTMLYLTWDANVYTVHLGAQVPVFLFGDCAFVRYGLRAYSHGVLFNKGKRPKYGSMHNDTLVLVLTVTFASTSSKNMVVFHTGAS